MRFEFTYPLKPHFQISIYCFILNQSTELTHFHVSPVLTPLRRNPHFTQIINGKRIFPCQIPHIFFAKSPRTSSHRPSPHRHCRRCSCRLACWRCHYNSCHQAGKMKGFINSASILLMEFFSINHKYIARQTIGPKYIDFVKTFVLANIQYLAPTMVIGLNGNKFRMAVIPDFFNTLSRFIAAVLYPLNSNDLL